jgi:glycosyltransferase involved in cell wall biosynthesis
LEALTKRLGIAEAVHFCGFRANAAELLKAFDVFALPSLKEYHSLGLLEAMRAGLPIVATAVGGNPESVEDGRSGLLVPPRDSGALAAAIMRCIEDSALRRSLGWEAKQRFESCFTMERHLQSTAAWLRRCCG